MQETQVPSLGWEDPLEEGNDSSLQYSCLIKSTDRGAWQATARGVAKSQTRLRPEHIRTKIEKGLTLGKFQGEQMQAEGNTEAKNSAARKGVHIRKAFPEISLQRPCFRHFLLLMPPFLQGSLQQEFCEVFSWNLGLGFLEGYLKGGYRRVPWNIDHKPVEMSEKDRQEGSILMVLKYFTGKIELFIDSLTLLIRKALWLFSKSNLWLLWLCVKMLVYSCLGKPMDRGDWQAVVHRVAKSQTEQKKLSMHACWFIMTLY